MAYQSDVVTVNLGFSPNLFTARNFLDLENMPGGVQVQYIASRQAENRNVNPEERCPSIEFYDSLQSWWVAKGVPSSDWGSRMSYVHNLLCGDKSRKPFNEKTGELFREFTTNSSGPLAVQGELRAEKEISSSDGVMEQQPSSSDSSKANMKNVSILLIVLGCVTLSRSRFIAGIL